MNKKAAGKKPAISIDEALNLFLAVAYPNGIPKGVDKEQLLRVLREKIAADRPEWAAANKKHTQASHTTESPPHSKEGQAYSSIKANIIEEAQKDEMPEDPEERYFYERRKEACKNREEKMAEEREDKIREDLRRQLIEKEKGVDDITLERALQIRQVLEQRINQALQIQSESKMPLYMTAPDSGGLAGLRNEQTSEEPENSLILESLVSDNSPRQEFDHDFFKSLKDLDSDEQIQSLKRFNQVRRARLKSREDVLNSRRPTLSSRRNEPLSMESKKSKDQDQIRTLHPLGPAKQNQIMFNQQGQSSRKRGLLSLKQKNEESSISGHLSLRKDVFSSRRPTCGLKRKESLEMSVEEREKNEKEDSMELTFENIRIKNSISGSNFSFGSNSKCQGLRLE